MRQKSIPLSSEPSLCSVHPLLTHLLETKNGLMTVGTVAPYLNP